MFLAELTIRISAFRSRFLVGKDMAWNLFDSIVVFGQVVEEMMSLFAQGWSLNVSVWRTMRIIRSARLIRLFRLLRYFRDLRTLISAIGSAVRPLSSTVVLLLVFMYIMSIFLVQSVHAATSREFVVGGTLEATRASELKDAQEKYFGSVLSSIMTVWLAISGGIDWAEVYVFLLRINP